MRRALLMPTLLLAACAPEPGTAPDVEDPSLEVCGLLDKSDPIGARSFVTDPVAELSIIDSDLDGTADTDAPYCTGVLISPEVLLTHGSCMASDGPAADFLTVPTPKPGKICSATKLEFGRLGTAPTQFQCQGVLEMTSDHALLRVRTALLPSGVFGFPGDLHGTLEPSPDPTGLPIGLRTEHTLVQYQVAGATVERQDAAVWDRSSADWYKYNFDTTVPSSPSASIGAPVLHDTELDVRALHARDGNCGTRWRGVGLTAIYPTSTWLQQNAWLSPRTLGAPLLASSFGAALHIADVHGSPGIQDLVVGAPDGGVPAGGRVLVRQGITEGLSTENDLVLDRGAAAATGEEFGGALASGDFDGDGLLDIVVGIPGWDPGSVPHAGAFEVYDGAGLPGSVTLHTAMDFVSWAVIYQVDAEMGAAFAVEDFNGDGFDDLAVGSPGHGTGGKVLIYEGSSGGLVASNVLSRDPLSGGSPTGADFGWSLAAGDFNGDGEPDLAVGAPSEDRTDVGGEGVVHVFTSGLTSGVTPTSAHRVVPPAKSVVPGAAFGWSIAAGDVNDDSADDLLIGAPFDEAKTAPGTPESGYAEIWFGGSMSGSPFWAVSGIDKKTYGPYPAPGDQHGWHVAIQDVDRDGRGEMFIGTPGHDGGRGGVYRTDCVVGTSTTLAGWGKLGMDDVSGPTNARDRVGESFAIGNVLPDADMELVVGHPYETVGNGLGLELANAGGVAIYPIVP